MINPGDFFLPNAFETIGWAIRTKTILDTGCLMLDVVDPHRRAQFQLFDISNLLMCYLYSQSSIQKQASSPPVGRQVLGCEFPSRWAKYTLFQNIIVDNE